MHTDAVLSPDQPTDDELVRGWIAAADVAARSASTLRRMVQRGELDAVQGPDGVYEFRREHLEALRPGPRDTDLVAAVFRDLDARKPLTVLVAERKVDVEVIENIHEQWRRLREIDVSADSVPRELVELRRAVHELAGDLQQLRDRGLLGELASDYTCASCASTGAVAVRVMCTSCNREEWLGFWPHIERAGATLG